MLHIPVHPLFPMTSIVIEFVSRVLFSLLWMQAELLAFLRPAQLVVGRLLTKNRCHALFTIRFPTSSPLDIPRISQTEGNSLTILQVLAGISRQNRNYHVVKAVRSSDGRTGRFEALYLTPLFKWTDVVELTILPTTSKLVNIFVWARFSCVTRICWQVVVRS